jgi:type VI secretion system secreted protein VgrG
MTPATGRVDAAVQQMAYWQEIARSHHSRAPASEALEQFQTDADALKDAAILLSAPRGIGAVTPASLLLESGKALHVQSQDDINLAAAECLFAHANQSISLLAQEEGMRLVSGKGPLEIESHDDILNLIAQRDITLQSVQGHLQLTAKNGITLGSGGGFIRITPNGEIQIHSPGLISLKGQHRFNGPAAEQFDLPELPGSVCKECLKRAKAQSLGFAIREPQV